MFLQVLIYLGNYRSTDTIEVLKFDCHISITATINRSTDTIEVLKFGVNDGINFDAPDQPIQLKY